MVIIALSIIVLCFVITPPYFLFIYLFIYLALCTESYFMSDGIIAIYN